MVGTPYGRWLRQWLTSCGMVQLFSAVAGMEGKLIGEKTLKWRNMVRSARRESRRPGTVMSCSRCYLMLFNMAWNLLELASLEKLVVWLALTTGNLHNFR